MDLFKRCLADGLLSGACACADATCAGIRNTYRQARCGFDGRVFAELEAFAAINMPSFGRELLSHIYAERFASEDARRDVRAMIGEVAAAPRRRVQSRGWPSEQTRARAVEKPEAVVPLVGGARQHLVDRDGVGLSEGACLLQHAIDFCIRDTYALTARADRPATKDTLLNTSVRVANAHNSLALNATVITAAIMQPPFHGPAAPRAASPGGPGVVIGHELTRAFDNQGARHGKDGAVANRRADEDFAAFSERTGAVGGPFGSVGPIEGAPVHGELAAGEAMADLGGFACRLDILREGGASDDALPEFFERRATVWRILQTPECLTYPLGFDPHPPAYLRVDLVVQQFDEFYRLYGVAEGDRMHTAPEERLEVW